MRSLIAALLLAAAPGWAGSRQAFPLFFIPNAGQAPSAVRYMVQTPELRAAFHDGGAIYQLQGIQLRARFEGTASSATLRGEVELTGHANFLTGADPSRWSTNLATYASLVYSGLYPGIDLRYLADGGHLKSEYRLAPGADPKLIRTSYPAADGVSVDADGRLVIQAGEAVLREQPPVAYQESAAGRAPVEVSYRLLGDRQVGFALGAFDPALPLVIDPEISYSTYLGGSGMGAVTALDVDTAGNLYAAGWTEALDFPIAGALQASNRGGVDAFVVKLNPTGSALIYATYIGGNGDDRAYGIAVDSAGQAHLAGGTGSGNFPLVAAVRSLVVGGREAFALKLNGAGSALLYSTFLGGANHDEAAAIAVDDSGNAYIAGATQSADYMLANPVQAVYGGIGDGFLTKLTATGSVAMSTFLGGSHNDYVRGVAVDAAGNAHLTGGTQSVNFPVVAPIQGVSGGGLDAFVTKIKTTAATQILYSTYLGGSGGSPSAPEQGNGIALDSSGNVYVTGVTNSTNFPVTAGAFQTGFNGFRDAFATKINAAGTARLYSTYLGATGFDWANAIAVDSAGSAYVAGFTSSVAFAQVNAVQPGFNGLYDAFVSQLNPAGNALNFSTMYGGSGSDQAAALAVDASGNMFVGGQTGSFDFPLQAALQSVNVAGNTGWLARLGVTPPPADPPAVDSVDVTAPGDPAEYTAVYSHPDGAGNLTEAAFLIGVTAALDFACYVTYDPMTGLLTLANDVASSGGTSITPGSGTAANSQCTLEGAGTSVQVSGTTLTLVLSLSLEPGFPGNSTVYLRAADATVSTGWVAFDVEAQITADSVSPSVGSGDGEIFTFVFSDTQDPDNIATMAMLFNSSPAATNACYIVYDRAVNLISLLWDNAEGADLKLGGSSANLQNSQCAIGSIVETISGLSIILDVQVVFKGTFSGSKNIYLAAASQSNNTGFVQRGDYTVVAGGVPAAESVTPASGNGTSQPFTFTISEAGGSDFLLAAAMLFSTSPDTNNACSLVWDRNANSISLAWDNASGGATPLPLGSTGSVANSQCTLFGTGTSIDIGATQIDITVNLSFTAAFAGSKTVYLLAAEASTNSGWQTVGNWMVTALPPTADSITPSSGTDIFPTFVAVASDPASQENLNRLELLITPGGTTNACYIVYNRTTATIGLYNDAATVLSTKPVGSSATLQNTQCAVGYSSMTPSGNSISLTVGVLFKTPAFSGAKTIYLEAFTAANSSDPTVVGSWNVGGTPPTAVSINPASGAGDFPTFTTTVADEISGSNITRISMLITAAGPFDACYIVYNAAAGTIGLYDNGASELTTKPLGSSATLENSQCAIGYSSASVSGTDASMTVQVLFKLPGFAGSKTLYLMGDTAAASSGWVARGSWIAGN